MKKIKPYNFFGIVGLLLFAVSFFIPSQIVDIHTGDTYYVFEMSYAFRNMACASLALFTICTFFKQKLFSNVLTWIHTILTILTFLLGILFLYKATEAYRPNFSNWSSFQRNNEIIVATMMVFFLAQGLFVVNLLVGAFKPSKRLTGVK